MFELSAYSVEMARDLRRHDIEAAQARALRRRAAGAGASKGWPMGVTFMHRAAIRVRALAART
jgi:hypothetical protein